ncbi:hypothetical protein Tco_1179513 [Tanacetum coccineum]
MGDENPIRTIGDHSKPSHKGYMNSIKLAVGNNVVPLRSDTIRLVQNGCSFYGLRSEDPNQHLMDFLKLVDSLNLDGDNKERTYLRLFQFSLHDQASNWLERLPAVQIFYDHVNPVTRRTIDQSAGGKLRDLNVEESWALLEDLALYDNKSWNEPRDFSKPVKVITLPQDVPSISDRLLIELENQVQRLMEAHLAPTQPTQVNKITTLYEIRSGPHDTQYCMEDPKQAFVEYASLRIDEARGKWYTFKPEQNNLGDTYNPSWKSHPNLSTKENEEEECNLGNANSDPHPQHDPLTSIATKTVRKLSSFLGELGLVPQIPDVEFVCTKDGDVLFIKIIKKNEPDERDPREVEERSIKEVEIEYFDTFPTRDELTYHRYLMSGPVPSIFLRDPIITTRCPKNIKIPCNIGNLNIGMAYIDLNSPLNIMTRVQYNQIIRRKLEPRENGNGFRGVSNFARRVRVLGKPFVKVSRMTYDLDEGVVRFTNGNSEVAYKMPHMIEQYNSLTDEELEHTKSVYFRNQEDREKGVDYVMNKILGFYKECLELGPEYLTRLEDEGEVT